MKNLKIVIPIVLCILMILMPSCAKNSDVETFNANDSTLLINTEIIEESTMQSTIEIIETTTEKIIIEDNNLYLSKPNIDIYTDFIYCKETGTKANIFSELSTFIADMDIEYISKIWGFDPRICYGSHEDMHIRKRFDSPYLGNIYINKNEEYTFGFNGNIFIGDSLDDIKNTYGEPDSQYDSVYGMDAAIGYNLENVSLNIRHKNNKVTKFDISIKTSVPFLQCDNYLSIFGIETKDPNYAGGVDIDVTFSNDSEKTIKYIDFYVTPYNSVDDVVCSEIGKKSLASLRVTGPIETTKTTKKSSFKTVWYNSTIKYALLEFVEIIYMDGEEVTLYVK